MAGTRGPESSDPQRAMVRLGAMPIVDVAPVYIALRRGYFRDEGVDIQVKMLQGGGAGIRARFAEMAFPDMQAALGRKDIDAAIIVEPFLTRAVKEMGAVPVLDTMTGDADQLPIGGYATTTAFANGNPATLDAFRRALARAQREAADHTQVEAVITSYANVDSAIASQLHLGSYP